VRILVDGVKEAGIYTITWDGWNARGNKVSTGTYFYELVEGEKEEKIRETRKMIVIK